MPYELTLIIPRDSGYTHPTTFAFEGILCWEFDGFTRVDGVGGWRSVGENIIEEVSVYTVLFEPSPAETIGEVIARMQECIIREFREKAAYVTAREVLGGIKVA